MKNRNLLVFIVIGFIFTISLWGFVGGCGRSHLWWQSKPALLESEGAGVEKRHLEEASIPLEGSHYVVEPGDTLWGISRKFGISVSVIKEVNKLQSDDIFVGQKLILPGMDVKKEEDKEVKEGPAEIEVKRDEPPLLSSTQPKARPGLVVYKVRQNDSLWRIAQVYGTTIEHIAEINGLPKDTKLIPGQEILVPSN